MEVIIPIVTFFLGVLTAFFFRNIIPSNDIIHSNSQEETYTVLEITNAYALNTNPYRLDLIAFQLAEGEAKVIVDARLYDHSESSRSFTAEADPFLARLSQLEPKNLAEARFQLGKAATETIGNVSGNSLYKLEVKLILTRPIEIEPELEEEQVLE